MLETLLFATSQEMSSVLEKVQASFPMVRILPSARDDSSGFPVLLDLGAIDEGTWCQWAIENEIFSHCNTLVLLSLDPPEWMQVIFHAANMKDTAKKLDE